MIDRLTAGKQNRGRLAEAVENAIRLSGGTVVIDQETANSPRLGQRPGDIEGSEEDAPPPVSSSDLRYSAKYACSNCGVSYEPPSPQLFSFNSPLGMCTHCNGLGARHDFKVAELVEDGEKSLFQGALNLLGPVKKVGRWRRHIFEGVARTIETLADLPAGSFLKTPWNELPENARTYWLYGTGDRHITFAYRHSGGVWKHGGTWSGFVTELLDDYRKARNPMRRRQLEKYMDFVPCTICQGARLNEQARSVRITSTTAPALDDSPQPGMARARSRKSRIAAPVTQGPRRLERRSGRCRSPRYAA